MRTRNRYTPSCPPCLQVQVDLVPVMKQGVFTKQNAFFQSSELLNSRQAFSGFACAALFPVLSPLIVSLTYSKVLKTKKTKKDNI